MWPRRDDRDRDAFLKPLHRAHYQRAVGPRTGKSRVEMIPPVLGGEAGRPVGGYEPATPPPRPHNRSVVRAAIPLVVGEPFAIDQHSHGEFRSGRVAESDRAL